MSNDGAITTFRLRLNCFEQGSELRFPQLNRGAHLFYIKVSVIDLGHCAHDAIRLVLQAAEFVIEKLLDDVRRDLERGETGGDGAAEIVQDPIRNPARLVERLFAFRPSVERRRRFAAHVRSARGE